MSEQTAGFLHSIGISPEQRDIESADNTTERKRFFNSLITANLIALKKSI